MIAYLQVKFIAGVTSIELGALDSELSVKGGRSEPVTISNLPKNLFIVVHVVHT